ncbi:Zinc ABC transporter, ATP-binding protein ZnuC [Candidatus Hepatincolaceae symbiont of Richtersius coronifer]
MFKNSLNLPLLKLENIEVRKNNKYLLRDISLEIHLGEIITIIGENGSGKTTLCKVITNNLKINTGKIIKAPKLKISYIPQIGNYNILIPLRVLDFIFLNQIKKKLTDDDLAIINSLNIEHLLITQLHKLSGGEKQRVILARALILNPDLLILDEPLSFVDFKSKNEIYNIINSLRIKNNLAIIMVSHDLNLVLKDTNWSLCLHKGTIGCQGNTKDLKNNADFNKLFGDSFKYYHHDHH